MYYPRFTKVIINHFRSQDQSILRRNKVDWHMANDDPILTIMRFIPQHEVVQKYGAILPDNLTTQAMKESKAYKTYYAFATGKSILKPKYVRQPTKEKTEQAPKASSGKRIKATAKVARSGKKKQPAKGLETLSEINDGDTDNEPKLSTFDEKERQDDEDKEEEWFDDEAYDDENQGVNVEGEELDEEETNEEDKANELYKDVNVNLEGRDTEMTDAPRTIVQTTQVIEDTHVIITPVNPEDVPVTTIVETLLSSAATLPPPPIPLISHLQQTPVPTPATVLRFSLQDLPNLGVSSIPGIVDTCLANKMNEAIKTAIQLQSDRLRDEAQADNEGFINKLDDNINKIIKEQVKEQVKAQVSKIFTKIKKTINEQLEAEVLTRSSNESKTSYVVAANLFKLELKKILIDKMESNKSIHRSDEHKNLYKALVDTYKSDKLILETYGDTVSFKRHQDDEDNDEEPSVVSNRGYKRRRAGKELESTSTPKEKTSKTIGKSTEGSKSHHKSPTLLLTF
ncbi:hypothetical protein Tco_0123210 [Tanacetum coccineum]